MTDKQHASVTFSTDEIESQLHRLGNVLNFCDKNSRELQTVNLMAQRNVPVTFVQETPAAPPTSSTTDVTVGPSSGEEAKTKSGSPGESVSVQPAQSKSPSSANGSKSPEKKPQQKREHAKLRPFKEGRTSSPSAVDGADQRQSAPPVRRAIPVETTRLNG